MDIGFPKKLEPLFRPARFKAPEGGRGSAKSWGVAQALELLGGRAPLRMLCTREFQRSIKDSVHKLLKDTIARLNLGGFYSVTDTAITGRNGTEFIFAGLHSNIGQIKSMEGIDVCWVEEAETVSEDSWRALIPTIRKDSPELAAAYGLPAGSKTSAEIWVTFNPREAEDPTSKRFLLDPMPGTVVMEMNWRDNPWFPETLRKEMEHDKRTDFDAYEWIWEGKFRKRSKAEIMADKCRVEEFEPDPQAWDGPWGGMDFGYAQDPFSAHKYWAVGNRLYVEHELYQTGLELNDIKPAMLREIPGAERMLWRADNSRPETISHLRSAGLNVVAASKWAGSVEDGVAYLRSLDSVVIHPRCKGAVREKNLYRWKVDKMTGTVSSVPVDAFNHFWDDCRYALDEAIKMKDRELVLTHEEPILGRGITPELEQLDLEPQFAAF